MTDQEAEGFIKSNLIYIILLVVVFLLGLTITGWQWWQTSSELEATNKQLTETAKKLEREEIKGFIAAAIVETQRGEFELALKDASSFFTDLRNEVDKADGSAFLVEEITQLKAILNDRDQTIAAIAKQDKDSVKHLINIYLAYRNAIGDARQGSGNIPVEKENSDNSNSANQNSDNTEIDQQDSKNENSENSDVKEEKNANANVENPQTNSGDLKKPDANLKNEKSANSNSSKF